jgi:LCP family protein required for cell wall assembly
VLLAVAVFAACASGFASRETIEGGIRTVAALDPESDAISSRATQAGDENVLVLGLPAERTGVPEAARTDTAVLVHLPAGGAPAVTLGFPPTLEVARPPCQSWDPASGAYGATVPAESRTAFSAAYDVGGPKCAVDVAQQVTGLAVTRFVAFDLSGVNPLVGSVGGVGVCAERPVVDRALGPVVTRPGETVLGGAEAERFSAATGVEDASPVDRVRRQHRVLSAVLEDALSTPSLLTSGASDRVARALPGALTVDGAEAGDLLVLSRSLSLTKGEDAAPPYVSVPVNELPNTRGHLELNRSDAADLFSALQKHEPLPPAFTVPAQRSGSLLLPQGTVVDVMNAAGRSGLADEIATALRAQGYAIGAVGDAPPGPDTTIRFSPDRADASGVLAGSVPGARPEPDPGSTGTLQLVLGSSFPGATALGAPPPTGPRADCG